MYMLINLINKRVIRVWLPTIVGILILIGGGILTYQWWWAPKEEVMELEGEVPRKVAEQSPERVVTQFFQCWLTRGGPSEIAVEICGRLLEEGYKQSLLDLFKTEEIIFADPILWSQDNVYIEDLQVGDAVIQDNTASLIVTSLIWYNYKLKVSLLLINNEWRISNTTPI